MSWIKALQSWYVSSVYFADGISVLREKSDCQDYIGFIYTVFGICPRNRPWSLGHVVEAVLYLYCSSISSLWSARCVHARDFQSSSCCFSCLENTQLLPTHWEKLEDCWNNLRRQKWPKQATTCATWVRAVRKMCIPTWTFLWSVSFIFNQERHNFTLEPTLGWANIYAVIVIILNKAAFMLD